MGETNKKAQTLIKASGLKYSGSLPLAMFDYLADEKKRCPAWLGKLGFEWLFRLLYEPRRLWRRYILGSIEFTILCLKLSWGKNEK